MGTRAPGYFYGVNYASIVASKPDYFSSYRGSDRNGVFRVSAWQLGAPRARASAVTTRKRALTTHHAFVRLIDLLDGKFFIHGTHPGEQAGCECVFRVDG